MKREERSFLPGRTLERENPVSRMNQMGIPIGFQTNAQPSWTLLLPQGAIPIRCLASQPFPPMISQDLSILPNQQSSHAGDQLSLPTSAGASSGEEVRDIIQAPIRERRKVVFWTKEEHRNFLIGLNLYGKGKWKKISKQAVKTKSPSQVASHAQKYSLRQNMAPEKRKRFSIHDTTVADVISLPQKQPRRLPVASPIGPPTPFSQQEPQHPMAPTTQPAAAVESQDFPTTSYAPVPDPFSPLMNVYQSDGLLYLPQWNGHHDLVNYFPGRDIMHDCPSSRFLMHKP